MLIFVALVTGAAVAAMLLAAIRGLEVAVIILVLLLVFRPSNVPAPGRGVGQVLRGVGVHRPCPPCQAGPAGSDVYLERATRGGFVALSGFWPLGLALAVRVRGAVTDYPEAARRRILGLRAGLVEAGWTWSPPGRPLPT